MSLALQPDGAPSPDAAASVAPGTAHLWLIDLELGAGTLEDAELLTILSEHQRAARLRRPLDRVRFLRGRAALRLVLSTYAGCRPRAVDLRADEKGRPFLADLDRFDFNSSGSGGFAAIAVSTDSRVGIDIEAIQADFPCRQLAQRFFSAEENRTLERLPADRLTAGFFQAWVAKEACVKAWGMGLSLPLNSFDVEADPGRAPALLHRRSCEPPLWLSAIAAPDGYAAALASDRPLRHARVNRLRFHELAAVGRA